MIIWNRILFTVTEPEMLCQVLLVHLGFSLLESLYFANSIIRFSSFCTLNLQNNLFKQTWSQNARMYSHLSFLWIPKRRPSIKFFSCSFFLYNIKITKKCHTTFKIWVILTKLLCLLDTWILYSLCQILTNIRCWTISIEHKIL